MLSICRSWVAVAIVAAAAHAQSFVTQPDTAPRGASVGAYDPIRARAVVCNPRNPSTKAQTWEWDGAWLPRTYQDPGGRATFDPLARHIVAFSGTYTLIWQGERWKGATALQSPSPRSGFGLCFDPVRGRVILFGGSRRGGGAMWEWYGNTWLEIQPSLTPRTQVDVSLVWDEARNRAVLVGGEAVSPTEGTWEWDGTNWRQASWSRPTAEYGVTAWFDPVRRRVMAYGGRSPSAGTVAGLSEWTGSTWRPVAGSIGPRDSMVAIPIPGQRRTLLVGGGSGVAPNRTEFHDVWQYDGTAFRKLNDQPHSMPHLQAVYDASRDESIVFGVDDSSSSQSSATWLWDGTWRRSRSPGPSLRAHPGLAHDPLRRTTVLFGGELPNSGGTTVFADTWEWGGLGWRKFSPATSPSPRAGAGMVFDQTRGRVILYGGYTWYGAVANDTWEWDGTNWQQLATTGPLPRSGSSMAYDPVRRRAVLFGSRRGMTDTWEWDGTQWLQRMPATTPPALTFPPMTYDAVLGKVVMVGGGPLNDIWYWDGFDWSPGGRVGSRSVLLSPSSLVHDRRRSLTYLLDPSPYTGSAPTVSVLGSPAASTAAMSVCALPGPRLVPIDQPRVSGSRITLDLYGGLANAPAVMVFSGARASLPWGNCSIAIDWTGRFADALIGLGQTGFGTLPLRIPRAPTLAGAAVHVQGFSWDPAAPFSIQPSGVVDLNFGY